MIETLSNSLPLCFARQKQVVTRATKWGLGIASLALLSILSASTLSIYFFSRALERNRLFSAADAEVHAGQCEQAMPKISRALTMSPTKIQASYGHGNLGYCHSQRGEYDKALAEYGEAIHYGPNFAWAYESRGLIHDRQLNYDAALLDYSEAIKLDVNAAESLYRRGLIYYSRAESDAAIADFREAIRARPDTSYLYFSLGQAQIRKNDWSGAIASFDTTIALDPNNAEAYQRRGGAYSALGNWQKAAADESRTRIYTGPSAPSSPLSGFPSINDGVATGLIRDGNAARRAKKFDEAIDYYTRALNAFPSKSNASIALMNRGNTYLAKLKLDDAWRDYDQAIAEDAKNAGAYVNRAEIALEKGKFAEALVDCSKAIEIDPNLGEAYINRGRAYAQKGDQTNAAADYAHAVSLNSNRPDVPLNGLAWIRATSKDKSLRNGAEAVNAATHACELTRWENPGVIDTLAAAYAEDGQFDKAMEMQERALADDHLSSEMRPTLKDHLELFKKRKPIRE